MTGDELYELGRAYRVAQHHFREAQRKLAVQELVVEAQRRAAKAAYDAYHDAAYEARPRAYMVVRP